MPRKDREAHNAYMREYYSTPERKEKKIKSDRESYCRNRDKRLASRKVYVEKNKSKILAFQREYYYQTKYGISVAEKEKMFETQNGLCYICGKQMPSWEECVVEHDHFTEEMRGLAHESCNIRLGVVENLAVIDPATLTNMLRISKYLV
jgi:hypothetical protein